MADSSRSIRIEPYDRNVASTNEAERVVREAIANSPENEKKKLEQWWIEAKENVARQWEDNQKRRNLGKMTYLG